MELSWSVLADGANLSAQGTLNVLGRFSKLWVNQLPARHPSMTLVLEFDSDPLTDVDVDRHLRIALVDPDGRELKTIDADMRVGQPTQPGPILSLFIVEVRDVEVRMTGLHEFRTLIDGVEQPVHTKFTVAMLPQQGTEQ